MNELDDMDTEELIETIRAREGEISSLKDTILKLQQQLQEERKESNRDAFLAEVADRRVDLLEQQLKATRELVEVQARVVAYMMVRLLPGCMSCDTAALIADHRDEIDGAAIAAIHARMKGGQIWREDVLAVLKQQRRQAHG